MKQKWIELELKVVDLDTIIANAKSSGAGCSSGGGPDDPHMCKPLGKLK